MKKLLKVVLAIVTFTFIGIVAFFIYQFREMDFSLFTQDWNNNDGEIISDLRYGVKERNTFDLYLPKDIDTKRENGLMLFIHGGSWNSGKKEDMAWACKRYAKAGYLTASMNYTLVGENSKGYINGMTNEIDECVKVLQHLTDSLDIKVTKMAIGGYSAGGHLAMLYAYTHRKTSAIPMAFCISYVGPSDMNFLFPIKEDFIDVANQELRIGKKGDTCNNLDGIIYSITGTLEENKEYCIQEIDSILKSVSPITYIDKDAPPSVFAYGEKDQLVRSPHADSLEARFMRHGAFFKMIRFPDSGHALENNPECVELLNTTILNFAKKYFGY